ncbi:MAG TPA: DegT/DnrJ/EryC1/StrS family aminotransferase [Candidatus Kapabacteria bacterium]|jgi:dTDP-4-amino-4,6-dideoxygalactose transaminase|nr:DegT/DnrJ/EryC1/StrS family aminotransferase [Candidatus Kapabacteria bacterium]
MSLETITRPIQMVDVIGQYHRYQQEIDEAILEVTRSGKYINGPYVQRFERAMASYLGVKHAIACASGTDALQLALMAIDLQPGDEVITTPFTFAATTETIVLLGGKPVYIDIDPMTFNLDVNLIEARITPRTRAILPVHLFGQPCDMTRIRDIAKKHNLVVIEDAAQAVGATWDGEKACGLGDMAAISFYPSKNLGCFGDGGMVTTNDDDLAQAIRVIANHGSERAYYHDRLGINSRLDAIQAAILNVKLQYLDEWNAARAATAEGYTKYFSAYPEQIQVPAVDERANPIWHQYSIVVKQGRERVIESLKRDGVPFNIYYPVPLHLQKAYAEGKRGDFPHTEFTADHILALPMHSELTPEDVEYIALKVIAALT